MGALQKNALALALALALARCRCIRGLLCTTLVQSDERAMAEDAAAIIDKATRSLAARRSLQGAHAVDCTLERLERAVALSGDRNVDLHTWLPATLIWLRWDYAINTTYGGSAQSLTLEQCMEMLRFSQLMDVPPSQWHAKVRVSDRHGKWFIDVLAQCAM